MNRNLCWYIQQNEVKIRISSERVDWVSTYLRKQRRNEQHLASDESFYLADSFQWINPTESQAVLNETHNSLLVLCVESVQRLSPQLVEQKLLYLPVLDGSSTSVRHLIDFCAFANLITP